MELSKLYTILPGRCLRKQLTSQQGDLGECWPYLPKAQRQQVGNFATEDSGDNGTILLNDLDSVGRRHRCRGGLARTHLIGVVCRFQHPDVRSEAYGDSIPPDSGSEG